MKSVVCQAYDQILKTGSMKLFKSHHPDYKDGEQLRDFVYVFDVVDAMCELMHRDHDGDSGIYNLGSGDARSFKDLVTATFKAMGKEANIEYIDMPESIRDQYQYYTKANMEKFHKSFSEFRFNSLESGVTDYVTKYLAKADPYLNSRR